MSEAGIDTTAEIRSRIATRFGISPEEAQHLLSGDDFETILTQAQRLEEKDRAARLAHANIAPREGSSLATHNVDQPMREFLAELFGRDE